MNNILEKIYKSSLKLLEPLDSDETYNILVNEAVKLVGGSSGTMVIKSRKGLKRVYSTSPELDQVKTRKKGFVYRALTTGKAFVIQRREFLRAHPEASYLGVASIIFIPLFYKGKTEGVLLVRSPEDKSFSNKELEILKLFGSLANLAIRKTQLYDETKKALESRDLFISMAAHELRTPLTAVNGYIQLLYSKLSGGESSESRWIEQLSWESLRLILLVNELLEINRIKTGEFQYSFKEHSLKVLIGRVVNTSKFTYPGREVIFEDKIGDKPDMFIGDADKILQVISNLVDNAVKFSSSLAPVVISLSSNSKLLVMEIKDKGIGIKKKEIPRILEGYYRSPDHNKEGMGLGLYVVNNIIRRHHGSIVFHSKIKGGTVVEIRLPKIKL